MALPEGEEWRLPEAYRNTLHFILSRLTQTPREILGEDPLPPLRPRSSKRNTAFRTDQSLSSENLNTTRSVLNRLSQNPREILGEDPLSPLRPKSSKKNTALRTDQSLSSRNLNTTRSVLGRLSQTPREILGEDPLSPLRPRPSKKIMPLGFLPPLSSLCRNTTHSVLSRRARAPRATSVEDTLSSPKPRTSQEHTLLQKYPLPPLRPRHLQRDAPVQKYPRLSSPSCIGSNTKTPISRRSSPISSSSAKTSRKNTETRRMDERKNKKTALERGCVLTSMSLGSKKRACAESDAQCQKRQRQEPRKPVLLRLRVRQPYQYQVDEDGFLIESPRRRTETRKRAMRGSVSIDKVSKKARTASKHAHQRFVIQHDQELRSNASADHLKAKRILPEGNCNPKRFRRCASTHAAREDAVTKPRWPPMLRSAKVPDEILRRWESNKQKAESTVSRNTKRSDTLTKNGLVAAAPKALGETCTSMSKPVVCSHKVKQKSQGNQLDRIEHSAAPKADKIKPRWPPMLRSVKVPDHIRRTWPQDKRDRNAASATTANRTQNSPEANGAAGGVRPGAKWTTMLRSVRVPDDLRRQWDAQL